MRWLKLKRTGKWEISLTVFKENGSKRYKVVRRLPEMSVAETKIFENEEDAIKQFDEWKK